MPTLYTGLTPTTAERTQNMTSEKHIQRAVMAMGSGATPEEAAEALMKTHVYPETAYLAVMAATILLKDVQIAGVDPGKS